MIKLGVIGTSWITKMFIEAAQKQQHMNYQKFILVQLNVGKIF